MRSQGPSSAGGSGSPTPSLGPGPGCAHAALHVRSRRQERTGCYLQAAHRRTLEGEPTEPPGTAALRALGTGLSPHLGRQRAEGPQLSRLRIAASLAGKEDERGAGLPQDTPREGGAGSPRPFRPPSPEPTLPPPARPQPHTSPRHPVRFRLLGAHAPS